MPPKPDEPPRQLFDLNAEREALNHRSDRLGAISGRLAVRQTQFTANQNEAIPEILAVIDREFMVNEGVNDENPTKILDEKMLIEDLEKMHDSDPLNESRIKKVQDALLENDTKKSELQAEEDRRIELDEQRAFERAQEEQARQERAERLRQQRERVAGLRATGALSEQTPNTPGGVQRLKKI